MKVTRLGINNAIAAAGRTVGAVVKGEEIIVDQATRDHRRSVCNAPCEFKAGLQCSKCECVISLKTMMAHESCPMGFWPAVQP